jgi:hypothetical protein
MLTVKTVTAHSEAVADILEIRGAQIRVGIRPWDSEIAGELRKKHTKGFEWQRDPETNRRVKVQILDDDAYFDDMVDYVLAWFEGIAGEDKVPWPNDLAHKKRLISLTLEKGAVPLWEQVLEKAKAAAFIRAEDEAEQLGNS